MPLRAERKSTLIHVAIVEDDDNYAETIQEYLKKFGKVQQEQFHGVKISMMDMKL